jgi:coenzyme F420-dependent glucose-6-phosphate dehydrogenase
MGVTKQAAQKRFVPRDDEQPGAQSFARFTSRARGAVVGAQEEARHEVHHGVAARALPVAARQGDGVWTMGDPEMAPDVIDAYRGACDDAGREPGEILLQVGFSWAEDDDRALEGTRVWKGAQPDEFYTDDWHRPKDMYEEGERQVSDEELAEGFIISSDPNEHAERVRDVEKLGATTVVLMNNSGADPLGAIGVYAEHVLPALRGARVG